MTPCPEITTSCQELVIELLMKCLERKFKLQNRRNLFNDVFIDWNTEERLTDIHSKSCGNIVEINFQNINLSLYKINSSFSILANFRMQRSRVFVLFYDIDWEIITS